MRTRTLVLFSGLIAASWSVNAQIPESGVTPALPEPKAPETRPAAPPVPVVPDAAPVLEKPKAAEKPPSSEPVVAKPVGSKPAEAPRVQEKAERQSAVPAAKSIIVKEIPVLAEEPPTPVPPPLEPPAPVLTAPAVKTSGAISVGCIVFSFAMLIIGIVAGFSWRHLASRRKLGGMYVRIGTWRGIP